MDFASESNSMMGPIGHGVPAVGWGAISLLSERRLFRLFTAVRGGRRFVLKALREPYCDDPAYNELLEREVALAMRLDHPNIVRVDGIETVPTVGRCIVMERIDGVTLSQTKKPGGDSAADRETRRRIACELADALAYAHEMGVSHRDLKPDNVMVTRRGGHVKVIDFGLGDADDFIGGKELRGTRSYGAPEQQNDLAGAVDHRADVWSFGKLLEEMKCGRDFVRIARRCQSADPDDRPSMAEVSESLNRLNHGRSNVPLYVGLLLASLGVALMANVMVGGRGESQDGEMQVGDTIVMRPDTVFVPVQATLQVDSAKAFVPVEGGLPSADEIRRATSDLAGESENMRAAADRATERAVGEFRRIYKEYYQYVNTIDVLEDNAGFVEANKKLDEEVKLINDEFERTLRQAGFPEYRVNEIRAGLMVKQSEIGTSAMGR